MWWLLSLWPCVSSPCVPPRYFLPVRTLESCFCPHLKPVAHLFGCPRRWSICSSVLTKPLLLVHRWGHSLVHGPSMVHLIWVESSFGPSPIFLLLSSLVTCLLLDSRNLQECFIWTRGRTAPLMTVCSITLFSYFGQCTDVGTDQWQVFMSLRCVVKDGCDEGHFFCSLCSPLVTVGWTWAWTEYLLEDQRHWLLPWWDVVGDKLWWGPLWCGEQCRHLLLPSSPTVFMIHFLKFQMVIPQCVFLIFMYQFGEVVKDVVYFVDILLGFFWILCSSIRPLLSSSSSSKSIMGGASFEAIFTHDVLDTNLRRGGNLVGTSKTRFRMVFLVGTAAYIGSKTQSACHALANFLHQPITIQYSLTMIDFSAWWVELRVQIKGKSPAGTTCWYSACAAAERNLVESSEMT